MIGMVDWHRFNKVGARLKSPGTTTAAPSSRCAARSTSSDCGTNLYGSQIKEELQKQRLLLGFEDYHFETDLALGNWQCFLG